MNNDNKRDNLFKVNIEDDNEAVGISTETKLTIKW